MRVKNLDLIMTMLVVVANVLWVLLPEHIPGVGIVLTVPLVFLLPGYTLTEALSNQRTLDIFHRLTFSLGLSLAIDVLSGFVLNMLPPGLSAMSWVKVLSLLIIVCSFAAAYRRRGGSANSTSAPRPSISAYGMVVYGLATIVTVVAICYSAIGVVQQPHPGFTQLWMLPPARGSKSCAVRLGLHSFEATTTSYRVTMSINGQPFTAWQPVVLDTQQEWQQDVQVNPGTMNNVYVEVQVYQANKPGLVYRRVSLLLHASGKSQDGQVQQCET